MNDDAGISEGSAPTRFTPIHQRYRVTVTLKMERARDADATCADHDDIARSGIINFGRKWRYFGHVPIVAAFTASSHPNLWPVSPVMDPCLLDSEPLYVRLPTGNLCRIQDP